MGETAAATSATSGLSGLGLGGWGSMMQGAGSLINAGTGIYSAYWGVKLGKANVEEMKKQNELLRDQYNEEVKRYNKREAQQDAADNYIQGMAGDIYSRYYSNNNDNNNSANSDNANQQSSLAGNSALPTERM